MNISCKRLMMPLRKFFLGSVIVLLLISGVVTVDNWGVSYTPNYICALKGSAVNMSCTYTYPFGYRVQKVFWSTELTANGGEPPDLASDPAYRNRIQYIGDKENDCTLKLHDVSEQDQRRYYFRFITEQPKERYQGRDGVLLSVTETISVEVPENVVAGTAVTLTCKTTCTLTYQTFTWYKNGQKLNHNNKSLDLESVSREKAESYRCAVGDLQSPAVTLNVQYPPERVSVSISPSGEKVEGSLETLTCSSDANPPVHSYTWFKEGGDSPVGSGQSYNVLQAGSYYCVAQNIYGNRTATALSVPLNGDNSAVLYVVTGVVAVCLVAIIVGLVIWRRRRGSSADDAKPSQENVYSNVETRPSTNNQTSDHDEVEYASVLNQAPNKPRKVKSSPVKASGSGSTDEFLYATVPPHDEKVAGKPQEDDLQYSSITFTHSGAASRSAALRAEDCSVIYSSVK